MAPAMIRGDGAGSRDELGSPFVDRRTYRRRRLMDLARLLPIFGALAFAVPLLWPDPDPYPAPGSHGGLALSTAITYLFVVWALLILMVFGFGIAVQRWAGHWTAGGAELGRTSTDAQDQDLSAPDADGDQSRRSKTDISTTDGGG